MTRFGADDGFLGYRDKAGYRWITGVAWAATVLFLGAIPGLAANQPDSQDPYVVTDLEFAPAIRQVVEAPKSGDFAASPRLEQLLSDSRALALQGREIPPHSLTSSGIENPLAIQDPVAASLEVAQSHPALVAIQAADLSLAARKDAGDLTYVHFRQSAAGLPIHGTKVTFLWDGAGRLRMSGADVYFDDLLSPAPVVPRPAWITEQGARSGATEGMPTDLDIREWEFAEQLWLPLPGGDTGFRLVPAWNIRFRTSSPPGWYDALVHGETGRLLSRENRIHFETISGQLTGWVEPLSPGDPQQRLAMPNQFVQFMTSGAPVLTRSDAEGNFSAELPGAGSYLANNALAGQYILVRDVMNNNQVPVVSRNVSAPGQLDHLWSDENSNESQRDAYYHGNVAYAAIRAIDNTPGIAQLDVPMPTDVDDPSGSCNAYWDGTRMNFYAESSRCAATARIADVVYHEYGHAVTQWSYWPFLAPSDIHEGLSDYFAATIRNDPRIGVGFFGAGTVLRSIEPDLVYPEDVDNDPHVTGLIVGGALWDLRQDLGKEITDRLFHFARYGAPQSFDDYMLQVLLVDDDDADLTNGTPHFDQILEAFQRHGIGNLEVSITAPLIPDFEEPGPTIAVEVTVFSLLGVDPAELSLFVDLDGLGFTRIPMVSTGEPRQYRVEIASPPRGTTVHYYWAAADTAGHSAVLPEGAPAETYSFFVGKDEISPVIVSEVPTAFAENQTRFYFRAHISDNSQKLGSLRAEFRVGGENAQTVALTPRGGDEYDALLELGTLAAGQEVFYRLLATDEASDPNTGAFPATGELRVPVRRGRAYDFEEPVTALEIDGDWETGAVSEARFAYSGAGVLATRLDDRYTDDQTSTVLWGPVDLSGFSRARLQFRHQQFIEAFWDGGNVKITNDPVGGRWSLLEPVGGYPFGRVDALGEPGFSGVAGWSEAVFPLDFQLGEEVYFRFTFASDVGVRDYGWYIDDLMVVEAQAWVDPGRLTASSGEDARVTLRWGYPQGIDRNSGRWTGFDVYRTTGADPFPENPLNASPLQEVVYVDEDVINGVHYRYRVVAIYDDGQSPGVEAVGSPFSATVGIDVSSVAVTLASYEDADAGFRISNRGAGTLSFEVFLGDADAEFGDVVATYAVPSEGPTDAEMLAADPPEGSAVDLASMSARRWNDDENREFVEFRLEGHAPWGDPIREWGGVFLIDTDGNLDTSQEADFDLGWSEATNMGWELAVVFGSLPGQVGLPGVAVLVDAGSETQPRILRNVEFPNGGSSIAFSVPLDEFPAAANLRTLAILARGFGAPPLDYLPDLPTAASWLERTPRRGQAVLGQQKPIDLSLGNPNLRNGTYHAQLFVRSNDRVNPVVKLPVTLTVARGIPPVLSDVRLLATLSGMRVAVLPSPALPPTAVYVERSGGGDEEWAPVGGPLEVDASGFYRFVDTDVAIGQTYRYRFPIEFPDDQAQTYGPFEQRFSPPVPDLHARSFDVRLSGMVISFTLDADVATSEIFVERAAQDSEKYLRLNDTPLAADSSQVVSYLDATVEEGASYHYRFAVTLPDGLTIHYGPFEATYQVFPAELADLTLISLQEGIEISFTVPVQLDVLQGVWIERRKAGEGEFALRNEETLAPDVEGRVSLLDPWSVPWADGLEPGIDYEYRARLVGPQNREHTYVFEPFSFSPPVPTQLALLPSRPNPFRDRVLFRVDLPAQKKVALEVFDPSGRRIAVLIDGVLPAGAHQREWDGRADNGERAPSGVYFARLRADGEEKKLRVLRVR